ncbi:DUF397 domain-containing protein [Kitasatospora sp. NBC_01250]|uniref:DUF397 domain-containing protein n=1 Tax=unclassified Kitasatospora TaxID=2633591 RepID=UPI002E0E0081|nr:MULTISPECIES: DUF397 domain-containing protein [unclassified Kitasatospora]WSJ67386.1 DUF397 domain-containing protein [Kitasatospora sp. NBC_01302]
MDFDLSSTRWIKSRHSGNGGECVEIAPDIPGLVPVRDSKSPTGPALAFPATAFSSFLAAVKRGDLATS